MRDGLYKNERKKERERGENIHAKERQRGDTAEVRKRD